MTKPTLRPIYCLCIILEPPYKITLRIYYSYVVLLYY